MKHFLWLLILIAFALGGCSQANMRGNETVRTYNITINNGEGAMLSVDMPLQVDAVTSEKTDMTADNDPATDVSTPISLAAQGATATTAAEGATQELSELLNDYKQWQDFRKEHSDNVTNPDTPTTTPPVVTPVPTKPDEPTEPTTPTDPDMHGFTHKLTIQNTGDKMSYRSGDEESVDQDKFIFDGILGDQFGSDGGLIVFSDGNELKVPSMTSMAMLGEEHGYRKYQPGGKYSNNNPSIPWAETYASRYTHPASVTLYYNGTGDVPGEVDPVDPSLPTPGLPSDITWLHTDVSGWKVTADLQSVSTTSSTISLPYDKAKVWPSVTKGSGTIVNANPWIMVKQDGKWYAATWEWFRPGQTSKSKSSVAGDHIKQSPLKDFKPVVGETYYFMVSGLARDSTRNVEERSQWVKFIWQ